MRQSLSHMLQERSCSLVGLRFSFRQSCATDHPSEFEQQDGGLLRDLSFPSGNSNSRLIEPVGRVEWAIPDPAGRVLADGQLARSHLLPHVGCRW